jgi:predicted DNA-binding transcriptional regulator AlpA
LSVGDSTSASGVRRDRRLLLPMSDAARMLGFSRSTVVRACDAGEFPVVTFRGMRRVPRAFIEGVIAAATPGRVVAIEDHVAAWNAATAEIAEVA